MSDRMWSYLSFFFTITIIIGGLTLAYFGERGQIGFIMDSVILKTALITFCLIGAFIMVYSEVRKRVDKNSTSRAAGVTLIILLAVGVLFSITRL